MSKDLLNTKHFCMLPWIHQHVYADGRVYPCCVAAYQLPLGDLKQNTMEEVWNNDAYKKLRQNMMNDEASIQCFKCYEHEKNGIFSLRNSINKSHGQYVDEVALTKEDGEHPEFKIRYWDVRFSNLCNFSCRSCGPAFSSKWFKDHVEMYGTKPKVNGREMQTVEYAGRTKTDILEQMEPHIPYMDQVYFAGGEPLLMEEHYVILERLIELGKTDINIQYNTNFSELSYKKRDVLDLWSHFSNISVGASLDASYARGELMRKGTDWAQTMRNREEMIKRAPHVDFYISATVSLMNILHVPDFHREWVELGFIRPQDFNVNVLQGPQWYRPDVLPVDFKTNVVKPKLEEHIAWLEPQDPVTRATIGYRGLINSMMANDNTQFLEQLYAETSKLDGARGEDFWSVFPELRAVRKDDNLCILPWVSLETSPIGTVRPCCLAEDEITKEDGTKYDLQEDDPKDVFNSQYMKNLRQEFRNGGKPATCKKCWVEEDAGRLSKRQNSLIKFKHRLSEVPVHQDEVDAPWFLDLKLGNVCNLKCRICGSWSSSKWAGEEIDYLKQEGTPRDIIKQHTAYQMLKKGAWPKDNPKFWDSLHDMMKHIDYIEFTGGEPFLIQEHFELLKFAVDNDYASGIELHYNTNGTVFPDFADTWKKFKRVEIAFSVDDVGARFEYQRYGAKWDEVNTNIDKFVALRDEAPDVFDLQLCFTVNILNVLYLHDLLGWAETKNFNTLFWNMLHGPEELSIACIPEYAKAQVIGYVLKQKVEQRPGYEDDYDNIVRMIEQGTSLEPKQLFRRLEQTDKYRKQHLSDDHSELAEILKYGKT